MSGLWDGQYEIVISDKTQDKQRSVEHMKSIFIDLEFCEVGKEYKRERKMSTHEVIEIGAVKLDEDNHIIERFDAYVKPMYSEITPFITELTHIEPEDVVNARSFSEIMDAFLAWVGEEEVAVYSWSDSDWRQFQKECILKDYSNHRLNRMYDNWADFQMMFGKILGVEQQISLTNAIKGAGIEFEGRAHSAIADAENTALLYALTQDSDRFEAAAGEIIELMRPKPALAVMLGSFFSEELLQQLPA